MKGLKLKLFARTVSLEDIRQISLGELLRANQGEVLTTVLKISSPKIYKLIQFLDLSLNSDYLYLVNYPSVYNNRAIRLNKAPGVVKVEGESEKIYIGDLVVSKKVSEAMCKTRGVYFDLTKCYDREAKASIEKFFSTLGIPKGVSKVYLDLSPFTGGAKEPKPEEKLKFSCSIHYEDTSKPMKNYQLNS